MRSGWTGTQFSIWRALTALAVMVYALTIWGIFFSQFDFGQPFQIGFSVFIILAGTCLFFGWFARLGALCLFFFLLFRAGVAGLPLFFVLYGFLLVEPDPFGSFKARGRTDPLGTWHMESFIPIVSWVIWLSLFFYTPLLLAQYGTLPEKWEALTLFQKSGLIIVLLCIPLVLFAKTRPFAWLGMFLVQVLFIVLGIVPETWGALLLLLLAANPSWLSSEPELGKDLVYYDGSCGLCHRSCRFLLAEDPHGHCFLYAPLGGPTFEQQTVVLEHEPLPDSIVVRTASQKIYTEFAAVRYLGWRLGGLWRVLAILGKAVPVSLGNLIYRQVAKNRHKAFKRPNDTCPILPPKLRSRFLP